MNKNPSKFFDPYEAFFNLPIVRLFLLGITTTAILLSLIIIYHSNLVFDFSYKGINNLLTIFKVPLGILATLIPVLAVLAANHISEQSKESNRLSKEQNTFTNYYHHIDIFSQYIASYKNTKTKITNPRKLHNTLFPDAKNGDYRVSDVEIIKIIKLLTSIIKPIKEYTREKYIRTEKQRMEMLDNTAKAIVLFGEFAEATFEGETTIRSPSTRKEFSEEHQMTLEVSWKLTKLLIYACSFDPHYDNSRLKKLEKGFSNLMISDE